MVTELNEETFDDFVNKNRLAMVYFWASWCRPCKTMSPVIGELAEELEGKVAIAKLNIDENEGIAARFRVEAIPTMLVFREGIQLTSLVGLMPKEKVEGYLLGL